MYYFGDYLMLVVNILIVLPAVCLKIPVIVRMYVASYSDNLYLSGIALEILGYSILSLYNILNEYKYICYIESLIILVQLYFMAIHILIHRNMFGKLFVTLSITSYIVLVVAFITETFDKNNLTLLIPFVSALSGVSKFITVCEIATDECADDVSMPAWLLAISVDIGRILTAMFYYADAYLVVSHGVSVVLSLCVVLTALYIQTRPALDLRPLRD